jgi:H+/Cl- antiporter ClcA
MELSKGTQDLYRDGAQKLEEIKSQFLKLLPYWIAGSLTAVVATMYAKLFSFAEELSHYFYEKAGIFFVAVPVVFFSISWFLVRRYAPRANGSGIPQLMASIELLHLKKESFVENLLGFRIILVKIVSSLCGVLGGGAIGREGPTLQIAGSIFSLFIKYWNISDIQNRSAFIMAGAASGLASAFNTPLGGIVYVVEELAKSHLNTFRTGVLHAVIFAGIISQMIMGPYLYLGFPKIADFNDILIFQYIAIAMVSSVAVIVFSYLLKVLVKKRNEMVGGRSQFLLTLFAGLLFGLYAVFVSQKVMGPGKDLLNQFLFSNESAGILDVISRFIGSLLTYANGGAGGIFAPTLSLGGASGSCIDSFFNFNLGPLAVLVGMTAGLSTLTQSPLTSFILILEMTDRHKAIFPLMLAAIVGHGLSKLILKQSFYEYVCHSILKNYSGDHDESKS